MEYNESIGISAFDEKLANLFSQRHQINLSNPKTKFNFIDDMKRVKESLSLNRDVVLEFQADEDNETKYITVSRDNLSSLMGEFNLSLIQLCKSIKKNYTVDYVELVGGGSPIPMIRSLLKEFFNVKKISRSLNRKFGISLGALYIGSEKIFRVKNYSRKNLASTTSYLKLPNNVRRNLFQPNFAEDDSPYKVIEAKKNQKFVISEPDDHVEFSFNELVETSQIGIHFGLNIYGYTIPIEAYVGDRPIDFEINVVRRVNNLIKSSRNMEIYLIEQFKNQTELHSIINDFEKFLIDFNHYIQSKSIPSNLQTIFDSTSEWFEKRDEFYSKEDYLLKFQELKKIYEEILTSNDITDNL